MRLGGPISDPGDDPDRYIALAHAAGYRAIYCPLAPAATDDTVRRFREAAARADIVIAETGAWSNPLSPDETIRREALAKCQAMLDLAERVGACCCVNIAGSRGAKWDGPDRADLTEDTFDQIVLSVRAILDAVKPQRTFYTLEPMPWMFPDSADSYLRLIRAIDRTRFAVHFDPVNIVSSPQRYFASGDLIRDFVVRLGPHIRSCHAKDIILRDNLTVHLDECRPGMGRLDYPVLLQELDRLDPDMPLMLEHLPDATEYRLAAEYIRAQAAAAGVTL